MRQHDDRRMRRTQQALANAMISLTLEKGYDAVTIRDITERADIGYTTFFRHYRDKDDLLHDVLAAAFNEFIEQLDTQSSSTTDATVKGAMIFRYAQEHEKIIRVLFDSRTLRNELVTLSTQRLISKNSSHFRGEVPIEVVAQHLIISTLGLIEWWLENQMQYSPERMGAIYSALIATPLRQM
jgi:AcrR family transcriptional regulator